MPQLKIKSTTMHKCQVLFFTCIHTWEEPVVLLIYCICLGFISAEHLVQFLSQQELYVQKTERLVCKVAFSKAQQD